MDAPETSCPDGRDRVISAIDAAELYDVLRRINMRVPPTLNRLRSSCVEDFSLHHLLASLTGFNWIDYPISITRYDNGSEQLMLDFVIACGSGKQIGVEISELTNSRYKEARAQFAKLHPGRSFDSANYKTGMPYKPVKSLIPDELDGPPWSGYENEHEWVTLFGDVVQRNTGKLFAESNRRFDETWLLVYSQDTGGINVQFEVVRNRLAECMKRYRQLHEQQFTKIVVSYYNRFMNMHCDGWDEFPDAFFTVDFPKCERF